MVCGECCGARLFVSGWARSVVTDATCVQRFSLKGGYAGPTGAKVVHGGSKAAMCFSHRILSNFARDGSIVSHQIEQGIVRPSLHKALEGHTISRRCAAAGCTHVQNLPGKPARGCFCSAFCPFYL